MSAIVGAGAAAAAEGLVKVLVSVGLLGSFAPGEPSDRHTEWAGCLIPAPYGDNVSFVDQSRAECRDQLAWRSKHDDNPCNGGDVVDGVCVKPEL